MRQVVVEPKKEMLCWLKDGFLCSPSCIAFNPHNEGSIYQCRILDILDSIFSVLSDVLSEIEAGER